MGSQGMFSIRSSARDGEQLRRVLRAGTGSGVDCSRCWGLNRSAGAGRTIQLPAHLATANGGLPPSGVEHRQGPRRVQLPRVPTTAPLALRRSASTTTRSSERHRRLLASAHDLHVDCRQSHPRRRAPKPHQPEHGGTDARSICRWTKRSPKRRSAQKNREGLQGLTGAQQGQRSP